MFLWSFWALNHNFLIQLQKWWRRKKSATYARQCSSTPTLCVTIWSTTSAWSPKWVSKLLQTMQLSTENPNKTRVNLQKKPNQKFYNARNAARCSAAYRVWNTTWRGRYASTRVPQFQVLLCLDLKGHLISNWYFKGRLLCATSAACPSIWSKRGMPMLSGKCARSSRKSTWNSRSWRPLMWKLSWTRIRQLWCAINGTLGPIL